MESWSRKDASTSCAPAAAAGRHSRNCSSGSSAAKRSPTHWIGSRAVLRILRAFAWLRWRMLINSLEKTGARDTVERFSIAIEKLGPIMAAVLMVPSGLILAAAATASGLALARGDQHSLFFAAARYLLFAVPIVSIFGPLLLPAADRTNPVRLLLLPIPRHTLYAAQTSSAF